VLQALSRQQDKQHKGQQVRNAVPVHSQGANGQGHGVKLGVYQHSLYCATG
jgi:hypothetical protein